VLGTLWKKPLPSKLFHLERVAHRPDNPPLPTTDASLTRREVIHKLEHELTLASMPHAVQHCVAATTNWEKQTRASPNRFNNHGIVSPFLFRDCTRVFLQRYDGFPLRRSGRMEKNPPPRFISAIIFACTRVDTCHPWNCMHSTSTRSSHHLGIHVSFQKDLG
jgi:hypothetical protein